ncbi:MAG: hypothetical protein DMD79_01910 [Candidatus Rokuibacteriota bacterium]|nr:MAG: hypothetical protein DMD79_01910 [Candidatus Rokubacteria bacterium]
MTCSARSSPGPGSRWWWGSCRSWAGWWRARPWAWRRGPSPAAAPLAITALLGVSLWNVIGAVALTFLPTFAILVRGEVLSLREREFITAATALGSRRLRIMWRHLLPNLSDVLLVQASFGFGTAILTEASLSFLGLGMPPPALSWGRLLREGYSFLLLAPWIAVASGAAIFVVVLAFQMLADGLQDVFGRRAR